MLHAIAEVSMHAVPALHLRYPQGRSAASIQYAGSADVDEDAHGLRLSPRTALIRRAAAARGYRQVGETATVVVSVRPSSSSVVVKPGCCEGSWTWASRCWPELSRSSASTSRRPAGSNV